LGEKNSTGSDYYRMVPVLFYILGIVSLSLNLNQNIDI